MKKTLILETYPFEPHLEISGEIALDLKKNYNEKVYFGWLGSNLKWAEWHLPLYKKIFFSYNSRIEKFFKILKTNQVEIIDFDDTFPNEKKLIGWAKKFKGNIYDLKNYNFQGKNLGLGVASSLISFVHESNPKLKNFKDIVEKSLYTSAKIYFLSKKIINTYKPDKLVTFNGRFATSSAIAIAAKELDVKVIFHERGSSYDKYELFNDNLHNSDFRKKLINIHWKKNSKNKKRIQIAKNFFYQSKNGKRITFSGLKFKRNKISPILKIKKKEKIYTYFSSTSYEWDAILGYKKDCWKNEFEAISNLIKETKKRPDIKLIIRLHPFNKLLKSHKDMQNIKKIAKDNKIMLFDEKSNIDSYKLMKKSYAIITYGSTIGAEAVFQGKPSISMRNSFYSNNDTVYSAVNKKKLRNILNKKQLYKKNNKGVLPYAFYQMTFGKKFKYFKPLDYYSGYLCGERLSLLNPSMSNLVLQLKNFFKH